MAYLTLAQLEELVKLKITVAVLQDAVAYARNRLDTEHGYTQIASDLAVVYAYSVSQVGKLGRIS